MRPDLRAWIERPKYRFQANVQNYDQVQTQRLRERRQIRMMSANRGAARRHDRRAYCLLCRGSDHGRRYVDPGPAPESFTARANVPDIATEEYGKRLLAQTSELLGPHNSDPKMRYSGSGPRPAALVIWARAPSLARWLCMQATEHYPRFSARVGGTTDIEDRVNECMQRSMNGRALPANSPEMIAMASYIRSLGERNAAMGASLRKAKEPPAFKAP